MSLSREEPLGHERRGYRDLTFARCSNDNFLTALRLRSLDVAI
jgi:hypothetical protein